MEVYGSLVVIPGRSLGMICLASNVINVFSCVCVCVFQAAEAAASLGITAKGLKRKAPGGGQTNKAVTIGSNAVLYTQSSATAGEAPHKSLWSMNTCLLQL